jgi:hypothetical protein
VIVAPDFLDHPKTQMLVAVSGDRTAPLAVLRLWAYCQQRRSDSFEITGGEYFRAICRWEGEGDKLLDAMKQCGFVHLEGKRVTVHQWAEYNARLIAAWTNGAKGGRPPKRRNQDGTHGLPVVNSTQTRRKPSNNPNETDKSRADLTSGRDKTTTPQTATELGVEIPEALRTPAFSAAWTDYQQHRHEMRKKLTPLATKRLLSQLAGWGSDRAVESLQQSVRNGWTGVFEPKGETKNRANTGRNAGTFNDGKADSYSKAAR